MSPAIKGGNSLELPARFPDPPSPVHVGSVSASAPGTYFWVFDQVVESGSAPLVGFQISVDNSTWIDATSVVELIGPNVVLGYPTPPGGSGLFYRTLLGATGLNFNGGIVQPSTGNVETG